MIAAAGRYLGVTPGLTLTDATAAYWVQQATLRLRREVAWLWRQRLPEDGPTEGELPPTVDRLQESLDFQRQAMEKARFFREDVTARHLGDLLDRPIPSGAAPEPLRPGTWDFLTGSLALDGASQLLLGLCLSARLDSGLGPVLAACANDLARPHPSLALLQRLLDRPLAAASLADPGHPLFRYGLLAIPGEGGHGGLAWTRPVEMAPWLAIALAGEGSTKDTPLPFGLGRIASPDGAESSSKTGVGALPPSAAVLLERIRSAPTLSLQVLPLLGPRGCAFVPAAAALGQALDRPCAELPPGADPGRLNLPQVAAACWFLGHDLLLPEGWQDGIASGARQGQDWPSDLHALPMRVYLPVRDAASLKSLPAWCVLPPLPVPSLDYEDRRARMRHWLGAHAPALEEAISEAARRYRFESETLRAALAPLASRPQVGREDLLAALALEASVELGHLAEEVRPRFVLEELVLPAAQQTQIREITGSMRHLTEVHYGWGTARAWNEGGLSVLFCGAPGTGKTMAAEAVAADLCIPLYRVDLSQVVNKYIGETEKNLRRIFDATERTDCVLFFDEADALFGKRTEVKDAHDRFANIEISYLLERMERFKGLAILASNRRKDIDEAFLRRLRHIVEFPMPGASERERIWARVFPSGVDTIELDLPFLARQFPLAGGHIRSIAFNACLLAASEMAAGKAARKGEGGRPRVGMAPVLRSVRRELEKMNRPAGPELFGAYGSLLQEAET